MSKNYLYYGHIEVFSFFFMLMGISGTLVFKFHLPGIKLKVGQSGHIYLTLCNNDQR